MCTPLLFCLFRTQSTQAGDPCLCNVARQASLQVASPDEQHDRTIRTNEPNGYTLNGTNGRDERTAGSTTARDERAGRMNGFHRWCYPTAAMNERLQTVRDTTTPLGIKPKKIIFFLFGHLTERPGYLVGRSGSPRKYDESFTHFRNSSV